MSASVGTPRVPVSWGELLDKISILEIKRARIRDAGARANVERELRLLREIVGQLPDEAEVAALTARLREVNEALWEIEDGIRGREAAKDFGAEFIRLARSVYTRNDERAALKRALNRLLGSELVEEKSYAGGGFMLAGGAT